MLQNPWATSGLSFSGAILLGVAVARDPREGNVDLKNSISSWKKNKTLRKDFLYIIDSKN